jgi:uncharacterized protein involved in exopolysaccharide biosynthesis
MAYTPSPSPLQDPPGDVFGPLADYLLFALRAPLRHKRLSGAVFVAVVALAVLASWALPKKYRVDATLLAQRNPLIGALSGSASHREADSPTRAVREMVIRRDNLVALCRETDFLRMYRERRPPAVRARDWLLKTVARYERSEAQLLDDLVSSLQASLSVDVSNEGAVTIGFVWSDPEIAFRIVDAAVGNFVKSRAESDIGSLGDAIAILQGHDLRLQKEIAGAIHQLDEKEQALRIRTAPRRSAPAASGSRKDDDEHERLRATLTARRRALADVEEFRQRRTAELQAQLSQQLTIYAPEHPSVTGTRQAIASFSAPSPQVAELKAEIAQLERKLGERPGAGVEVSASAAAMDQSLAEARARLLEHTDPRLEYERRQLETLVRRHASLVERIESARIELDGARSAFEQRYPIITPAKRPRGPLKPYQLLFGVGGVIVGLLVACAVSAARDLWGGVILEPWQIEKSLQLPIIVRVRR